MKAKGRLIAHKNGLICIFSGKLRNKRKLPTDLGPTVSQGELQNHFCEFPMPNRQKEQWKKSDKEADDLDTSAPLRLPRDSASPRP